MYLDKDSEAFYLNSINQRKLRRIRRIQYGISFLDDMLGGIHPEDLIIIGARTGVGKTQIATQIALSAITQGKKVFFFALEAYQNEILDRMKYMEVSKEFFLNRDKYSYDIKLNFSDWYEDNFNDFPEIEALEIKICKELQQRLINLQIYTPSDVDFTKTSLDILYKEYCGDNFPEQETKVDLIILDHIHYLLPNDRETEYDHIKKTMILLRNLINKNEIPVIAMSHLRKTSFKERALVPTLEELHGSSEISKQANAVITLSPCFELPKINNPDELFEPADGTTFMAVPKTRTGHGGYYVAVNKFDLNTRKYEGNYCPYKISSDYSKVYPIQLQNFKSWMRNAKEAKI